MIGEAVLLRYSRIDIFLLIGLPAQTLISVRETPVVLPLPRLLARPI
jgi:hypothetical protein